MAALRSGLAMLGRRSCGCSASSSAASMARRGMEIHQVLRPGPSAVRNLESWRCFSTGGSEPKGKADSFWHLWRWAKDRVENMDSVTKTRAVGAYALVAIGTPTFYVLNDLRTRQPSP